MEVENFFQGIDHNRDLLNRDEWLNNKAIGFSNGDHHGMCIDINEQLIRNRNATFFLKVTGNSMKNAFIHKGDVLIVDKSLKPQSGSIVIAMIDGEMLIRRLEKNQNRLRLVPETSGLSAMEIAGYDDLVIWGIVTYVIKSMA